MTFDYKFDQSLERVALPSSQQSWTFGHEPNQSLRVSCCRSACRHRPGCRADQRLHTLKCSTSILCLRSFRAWRRSRCCSASDVAILIRAVIARRPWTAENQATPTSTLPVCSSCRDINLRLQVRPELARCHADVLVDIDSCRLLRPELQTGPLLSDMFV